MGGYFEKSDLLGYSLCIKLPFSLWFSQNKAHLCSNVSVLGGWKEQETLHTTQAKKSTIPYRAMRVESGW